MTILFTPSTGDSEFKLTSRRLDIRDFNNLPDMEACAALTRCCGSTRWVQAMLAQRPFDSFAVLFEKADDIWWSLDSYDWLEAFSHHPRIGDINHLRRRFSSSNPSSSDGEMAIPAASELTLQGLAYGNLEYEKRFDFIFIMNLAGKSAAEILSALQKRLRNEPETEIKIAAEQQRQIMSLRLSKWLSS